MPSDIRRGVRRLFTLGVRRSDLIQDDMDEELHFHIERRIEYLVARGLTPDQAREEAMRRLGTTLDNTRERLHRSAERKERRMALREWMDDFLNDVRYAARGLAHRPGFTLVAVATLAVGIGANTAIFSAVNALLLRPLPFREPDRLMEVSLTAPQESSGPAMSHVPWSFRKFALYREAQHSFSDVALWSDEMFNLTDGEAERVSGEWVSARYLATLGILPRTGRDFSAQEDAQPGAPKLAIISDALWSRRFNADPSMSGRTLDIDGSPFEVIGVLPPTFRGLSGRADVLVPITTRVPDDLAEPWSLEFSQVGRLRPGVTGAQATAEAAVLGKQVYDATPMKNMIGSGTKAPWSASARALDDTRVAPTIRRSLLVLFGAVGFVLLIACVNMANLLLGRATARGREIAIRLAIGARRARLVRLLVTESLLLAFLGGVASVLVAWWGTRALSAVNPPAALQAQQMSGLGVIGFANIRLDVPALVFTFAVALVVGVLFGLMPALRATRASLQEQLKEGGGGGDATPRGAGAMRGVSSRRVLVVAEVALALVLLAGAGLMIRSLNQLMHVDPGFDSSSVLTMRLNISPTQAPRDSLPGFYDELLTRMRGLPGVTSASIADCPPLNGGCNGTVITFPDRPAVPAAEAPSIGVHVVTPGWFSTMRVPLKRGRMLSDADRIGTPKVMLMSEAAAKKYWPNEDPIGKRAGVWQGGFQDGATVVGIVGDVRFGTIDSLPVADAYMSYLQSPRSRMMIFLRTAKDPGALAAAASAAVHELSPSYPAYDVRPMASRVAAASAQARLSAVLLALFAGVALALAVIGIYGVMSFAVTQRTREIGIRMALGADRRRVLRLVIAEGLGLAGVGTVVGVVVALALSRVLWSLLYDVQPTDPLTYVTIVVLLGGAAVLASWLPARRAARVEPTEALRSS